MSKALEIVEQHIPCTCGEMYLSRNMAAPDCPIHAFDWESTVKEIAELAFNEGHWQSEEGRDCKTSRDQFINDLFND